MASLRVVAASGLWDENWILAKGCRAIADNGGIEGFAESTKNELLVNGCLYSLSADVIWTPRIAF